MTATNPAPYPTRVADVTADGLAQSLAVSAQRRFLATMDAGALDPTAMTLFVREWGILFLLREIQERADTLARDLRKSWNDGGGLGESLWEWLGEYGINPGAITR